MGGDRLNAFERRFPRLFVLFDRAYTLVMSSLLFWLAAALVVTLPAGLAGLLATTASLSRPGAPTDLFGTFWRTVRRTFGSALALGLLSGLVGALLALDISIFIRWTNPIGWTLTFGFGLLAVFAAIAGTYAWVLLAWFRQPLTKVLKNGLLLAVAHPFQAVGSMTSASAAVWILYLLPAPFSLLLLLAGPGVAAALLNAAVWKVIQHYPIPED